MHYMNTPATKDADSVIELPAASFTRSEERAVPGLVPPSAATPMSMIAVAVQRGMDPATIKDLMDLQDRWEKAEARKAFVTALSAFKADPPELFKNKQVSYGEGTRKTAYKHATLDQVAIVTGQALAAHSLSFRWSTEQKEGGMIRVTCFLTHSRGHSESVWLEAGRDDSGSKNNIQALGSTITYLERYTLLAVTGMAVRDQDDDGKGADKKPEIEPDAEGKKALEACGSMASLADAWKALTKEQRLTLAGVKSECKDRIQEADRATA